MAAGRSLRNWIRFSIGQAACIPVEFAFMLGTSGLGPHLVRPVLFGQNKGTTSG